MRREFVPFDEEVIRKELNDLPSKDADKLVALMDHYQRTGHGNPAPAMIDDYGDGLFRLRHVKSSYSGRAIFFAAEKLPDGETLIILKIYKKEGQKSPLSVIETAKARRARWRRK